MQFKLKCALLEAKGPQTRAAGGRVLVAVASFILLGAGLTGCRSPAAQPAQSDQVQFSAEYFSTAERLLNQGFSDRDAATQALSQTIDTYRQGAFRTQAPAWQPHVSIETLPDGARRIAILLKQPPYNEHKIVRLARGSAMQGDPEPLAR